MRPKSKVIVSCEHASNRVPKNLKLRIPAQVLKTHRAFDIGAFELARKFAKKMSVPLFLAETSRLVVDLNRSTHNPRGLFSEYTKDLPAQTKDQLLKNYYEPYRSQVEEAIQKLVRTKKAVTHLSIHSFTPKLFGKVRPNDIGILYDPKVPAEKDFARRLKESFHVNAPELKVLCNIPYKGTSDGFTTWLRKKFKGKRYVGVEIEVNQKYPLLSAREWQALQTLICKSLEQALS